MITKFNEYINESLRDKMTPKSDEDVLNTLKGLNPIDKLKKIKQNKLDYLFPKEELDKLKQDVENSIKEIDFEGGSDSESKRLAINNRIKLTEIALQIDSVGIMKEILNHKLKTMDAIGEEFKDGSKDKRDYLNMLLNKALYHNSINIYKYLVNEIGVRINNRHGDIIAFAANAGYMDFLKFFLEERRFNINIGDGIILGTAIEKGKMEVVKYLLDIGAKTDNVEKYLKRAKMYRHDEVVDYVKNYIKEND